MAKVATKTAKAETAKKTYPLGITKADLEYPRWDVPEGQRLNYDVGTNGTLWLYNCKEFGWCVATLHISKSKNRNYPDRTYGVRLSDGQVVTMGGGPHVTERITVYVRKDRTEALSKLIERYDEGMGSANQIRNRIGSRRAQGSLMRSQGRTSWYWNV